MTIRVEIDTMIRRPIEVVFERLVDISGYAQWLPQAGIFIHTSQHAGGPVRVGTRYTDKTTVGTFEGDVIAFQRPTHIVFRHRLHWLGIPVMEARPGYTLEPANGGTRLHHVAEGRLFGVFKLVQPRVARIARAERRRTVAALKRSLEPDLA